MSNLKARLQKLEELRKQKTTRIRSFVRAGFRHIGGGRHNGRLAGLLKVPVMNETEWMEAAASETAKVARRNAEDVQADAQNT